MNEENFGDFGSVDATDRLWGFFKKQIDLLKLAYKSYPEKRTEISQVIYPLLYSAIDTSESILFLSEKGKFRDCYILARTAFETIVNICFICAKGEVAANRAKKHAIQKSYRDLSRQVDINGHRLSINWEGQIDINDHPELVEALAEFTSKKGREIKNWTPETLQEQIEMIDLRFGHDISGNFQFALISIYRHASEIAHGTYFGALYSLGLTSPNKPPNSPDELLNHRLQNLSMLYIMLGGSISALINVLSIITNTFKDLVSQSEKEIKELSNVSWYKNRKHNDNI